MWHTDWTHKVDTPLRYDACLHTPGSHFSPRVRIGQNSRSAYRRPIHRRLRPGLGKCIPGDLTQLKGLTKVKVGQASVHVLGRSLRGSVNDLDVVWFSALRMLWPWPPSRFLDHCIACFRLQRQGNTFDALVGVFMVDAGLFVCSWKFVRWRLKRTAEKCDEGCIIPCLF